MASDAQLPIEFQYPRLSEEASREEIIRDLNVFREELIQYLSSIQPYIEYVPGAPGELPPARFDGQQMLYPNASGPGYIGGVATAHQGILYFSPRLLGFPADIQKGGNLLPDPYTTVLGDYTTPPTCYFIQNAGATANRTITLINGTTPGQSIAFFCFQSGTLTLNWGGGSGQVILRKNEYFMLTWTIVGWL